LVIQVDKGKGQVKRSSKAKLGTVASFAKSSQVFFVGHPVVTTEK
jgi:hypothetical protein